MPIVIGPGISIGGGVSFVTPVVPVITIVDQPSNVSTWPGDNVLFQVNATVTPSVTLSYQWQVLPAGSGTWENIGIATGTLYGFEVSLSDNGNSYRVLVSAPGASTVTSDAALLTVTAAVITIDTQPSNQTASEGGTATFSVTASVTQFATLSYFWEVQAGGAGPYSPAGSTSSSYTTGTLTTGDNNNVYRVQLSADRGANPVTSNTATLTVTGGGGGGGTYTLGVDWTTGGLGIGGPPGGPYGITVFEANWINTAARDEILAKTTGTIFTATIGGVVTQVTMTGDFAEIFPGAQRAAVTVDPGPPVGETTSITVPGGGGGGTTVGLFNGQWSNSSTVVFIIPESDTANIALMDAVPSGSTLTITDINSLSTTVTLTGGLTKTGPFGPPGNQRYYWDGAVTAANPNFPAQYSYLVTVAY